MVMPASVQARDALFGISGNDSGTRKTLPADARTAFGFHALTVPGRLTTPVAPKASAERRIVPRLPGSCRPARTRTKGIDLRCRPSTCSHVHCGGSTSAAIGCGVSVASAGVEQLLRQLQNFHVPLHLKRIQQPLRLPARRRSLSRANRRAELLRSGLAPRYPRAPEARAQARSALCGVPSGAHCALLCDGVNGHRLAGSRCSCRFYGVLAALSTRAVIVKLAPQLVLC